MLTLHPLTSIAPLLAILGLNLTVVSLQLSKYGKHAIQGVPPYRRPLVTNGAVENVELAKQHPTWLPNNVPVNRIVSLSLSLKIGQLP